MSCVQIPRRRYGILCGSLLCSIRSPIDFPFPPALLPLAVLQLFGALPLAVFFNIPCIFASIRSVSSVDCVCNEYPKLTIHPMARAIPISEKSRRCDSQLGQGSRSVRGSVSPLHTPIYELQIILSSSRYPLDTRLRPTVCDSGLKSGTLQQPGWSLPHQRAKKLVWPRIQELL